MLKTMAMNVKFDLTLPRMVHLCTVYIDSSGDFQGPREKWPAVNEPYAKNMMRTVLALYGFHAFQVDLTPEGLLKRQEMIAHLRGVLAIENQDISYKKF